MASKIGRLFPLLCMCLLLIPDLRLSHRAEGQQNQLRAISPPSSPKEGQMSEFIINDAHCHFVDFNQDSDGIKPLLGAMNDAGVEHVVLFGLPVLKTQDINELARTSAYPDPVSKANDFSLTDFFVAHAVTQLPREQRKRIHPFICGFDPTDKKAVDQIKKMVDEYPNFWQGIGEIMTRRDDLIRVIPGETPRADHPALDAVYDFAAQQDLPVWIHSNIGKVGFQDPLYLNEIRNAVKKHPQTRFVWCHAGHAWYLRIPSLIQDVNDMLLNFNNLWIDLSWGVYEGIIAPGGIPAPSWVSLIEKYSDRFLLGSDKTGNFSGYKFEIQKFQPLLNALTPSAAQKIAQDNLWKVLPGKVIR